MRQQQQLHNTPGRQQDRTADTAPGTAAQPPCYAIIIRTLFGNQTFNELSKMEILLAIFAFILPPNSCIMVSTNEYRYGVFFRCKPDKLTPTYRDRIENLSKVRLNPKIGSGEGIYRNVRLNKSHWFLTSGVIVPLRDARIQSPLFLFPKGES